MADRKTKGSISGDAQMILDALDELHLPESFKLFVRKIRQSTYYKAGFHVDDGIEGIEEHSCYFSLAAWAKELGMSRQQLYNLRTDLIEHGVITYAPIPHEPHYGIVAWNLNVSEWKPFKKGGIRPGAGRPKKNQSVYKDNQSMYDSGNQSVYKNYSNGVQSEINRCTTDGNEASDGQAATAPLRNVSKKQQETGSDANASGGAAIADAPQPAVFPSQQEGVSAKRGGRSQSRASPRKGKDAWKDDPAWQAFYAEGKRIFEEKYGETYNHGREGKALAELFTQFHPSPEALADFWEATLIDPWWDTSDLSFTFLLSKYKTYKSNPAGYRAGMLRRRRAQIDRDQAAEKRGASTNGKPGNRAGSSIAQPATEHHPSSRGNIF